MEEQKRNIWPKLATAENVRWVHVCVGLTWSRIVAVTPQRCKLPLLLIARETLFTQRAEMLVTNVRFC